MSWRLLLADVNVPDGDDGGLRKSMHSGDAALSGRNGGGGGGCCY
jgi:hypothetical protein